jgi:hypothetical protein
VNGATLQALLAAGETTACCAAVYESSAVRWFLGDELHPGGEASTRRALELLDVGRGDRVLDVAAGSGASALLAAREFGCDAVGVDYGAAAVGDAQLAAARAGLGNHARFVVADAERLPFADGSFDAVLCECSLSTFADKPRAVAEIRRVLRRGGGVAISDVVAEVERLPEPLRGTIATLACVGGALSLAGYRDLLTTSRLETFAVEGLDAEADRLAGRLQDRLRFGRILDRCRANPELCPFGFDEALAGVRLARRALADGSLGYAIVAAEAR